MERHGVHPSVGPSMGPQQETRCCRFAAVGPVDRRYRPIVGSTARSSKRGQWRPRCRRGSTDLFCFYRAMLCIRGTSHGPVSVRLSIWPSQVGVLSKRLNESSWFMACELPSTRPRLC